MFIFRIYKYTIFLALEKWLKNEHSRRFHPRHFVISANAMEPGQILLLYLKSAGQKRKGAGTVLSFIVPVLFTYYLQRNFFRIILFSSQKSTKSLIQQERDRT